MADTTQGPQAEVSWRARLWDAFQTVVGDNAQKKRSLAEHIPQPGRILEIGCATGNVAEVFRGFDYVGVDIDSALIALAARKFQEPGFRFYCLDVLKDPLPETPEFDYVLISHTAHHLPDAYMSDLLHKAAELMRVGGELVILDMIRPASHEPFRKQFYVKLDQGEHFRNLEEFRVLIEREPAYDAPRFHLVQPTKLGIEVTEEVVIMARRRA